MKTILRLHFDHKRGYDGGCELFAQLQKYFGEYFIFRQPRVISRRDRDTERVIVYQDTALHMALLYEVQGFCRSLTVPFAATVTYKSARNKTPYWERWSCGVQEIVHGPCTKHAIQASFPHVEGLQALKSALQKRFPAYFDYDVPIEVDERGWYYVVWYAQDPAPYFQTCLRKMRDAHPDVEFEIKSVPADEPERILSYNGKPSE